MEEWEVAVESILAGVLWLVGTALVVIDMFGPDLGDLGLLAAGIGAVLTLRRSHLKAWTMYRDAFQLGRDFEHGKMRDGPGLTRVR